MASESVAKNPHPYVLPIDQVDMADRLIMQASGIVAIVGRVAPYEEDLPEHAIDGACWVIRDLLDQLREVVHTRQEQAA